ncbi:MAG: pentapeptide repeat-containing protein [Chitinophagaceae bacterium]|jgi:uncharacterized protein YjbI with pentapeptide repeats|nr:pentapeptide repeat-containing protein [Chitinophagaceae bacterium]
MPDAWFEDEFFEKRDTGQEPLLPGTYDGCRFSHCNMEGSDFAGFHFIDCRFEHCNLGNVKLAGTSLRNVLIVECKMIGVAFDQCHEVFFDVQFERSVLDLSVFHRRKMAGKKFHDCSLKEVDFSEADLSGASFEGSDLQGALFDLAKLGKADFRKALNYIIDPEKSQVKKARFSLEGLPGLLTKYDLDIS